MDKSHQTTATAWRPFSPDSPWNTKVAANPAVDPDSDNLIRHFVASHEKWPWLHINMEEYSIPVYYVDSRTAPKVPVKCTRIDGLTTNMFGRPMNMVPLPESARPAEGTDRHLCVADLAGGVSWDFWAMERREDGSWEAMVGCVTDLRGTGVRPPSATAENWIFAEGSRASGFPLLAGLIRVDEIRQGRIEHALMMAYTGNKPWHYTPPASRPDGGRREYGMPDGTHVQLDPSLDPADFGLSRAGTVVFRALQEYGAFIGDFSDGFTLAAEASEEALAQWNSGLLSAHEFATPPDNEGRRKSRIPLDRFRVLEIGTVYKREGKRRGQAGPPVASSPV